MRLLSYTLVGLALTVSLSTNAIAQCIGSGSFQQCYDDNGNEYTVSRMGNMTHVDGHNSRTGSSWSEDATTLGNQTIINGTDSHGRHWDETIFHNGNSVVYSGTDANGNSFYKTCYVDSLGNQSCY